MTISGKGRRDKGASFEREVAEMLRPIWPAARRNLSQTRTAKVEGGDVQNTHPFHIECKRGVATIQSAMRQAMRDCAESCAPVVVSRQDRGDTLVTMLAADWMSLVAAAYGERQG
jgi:hypothetical protein